MFRPNQEVIILKLYNLSSDGAGTIVKLVNYGEYKGKYLVDTTHGYIHIEPERIIATEEYWKEKNGNRN